MKNTIEWKNISQLYTFYTKSKLTCKSQKFYIFAVTY